VDPKRIAILIESSTSWGADVIRGVARFAAEHGPWAFFLEPYGRNEKLRLPEGWRGDGILARVNNPRLIEDLERARVPCVDLSWFDYSKGRLPRCTVDEAAVGRLAAEHFAERGLKHLAYCPPLRRPGYGNTLGHAFAEAAHRQGCVCHWLNRPEGQEHERPWKEEVDDLMVWLKGLAKPVGVLAFGDFGARRITEACWLAGLSVPDEVAVLGSEHDQLSALISMPPLSSVDVGAERVGHRAAELLDELMRDGVRPRRPILLPPVGVVARKSTDILATDDELVARACEFIRAEAHRGINVDDVVNHVLVSRRTLEQRFSADLGRAPAAMIRRVRVDIAKRMLLDTDRSLASIAMESGFQTTERMARGFRRELDATPQSFRGRRLLADR